MCVLTSPTYSRAHILSFPPMTKKDCPTLLCEAGRPAGVLDRSCFPSSAALFSLLHHQFLPLSWTFPNSPQRHCGFMPLVNNRTVWTSLFPSASGPFSATFLSKDPLKSCLCSASCYLLWQLQHHLPNCPGHSHQAAPAKPSGATLFSCLTSHHDLAQRMLPPPSGFPDHLFQFSSSLSDRSLPCPVSSSAP